MQSLAFHPHRLKKNGDGSFPYIRALAKYYSIDSYYQSIIFFPFSKIIRLECKNQGFYRIANQTFMFPGSLLHIESIDFINPHFFLIALCGSRPLRSQVSSLLSSPIYQAYGIVHYHKLYCYVIDKSFPSNYSSALTPIGSTTLNLLLSGSKSHVRHISYLECEIETAHIL